MSTKTVTIKTDEVTVTLADEVLHDAGWIPEHKAFDYCTEAHCDHTDYEVVREAVTSANQILERWHNDHHQGAYRFCYEEPCKDVRAVCE